VTVAQPFKPPSTQRVYDVCVVGPHLGGAVAGALLARRGFRVLHVDHDGTGSGYEDGGYLLPWAPALFPVLRGLPAAEAALQELGYTPDAGRALEPATPPLQLLLPRNRLDLHADPAQRLAELRREFPADAAALDGTLRALSRQFEAATPLLKALPPLPPDGFGERRALSKARRIGDLDVDAAPLDDGGDHLLLRALRFAARPLGHLDGALPPLAAARLLGGALRGTLRHPAGEDGLRDLVRRRIAETRGELLGAETPAPADGFELDGSRVTAVRLAGSPNAYVARVFVVATGPAATLRLFPEELRRKLDGLQGVAPSRELVAVNLVVKAAALPPAMGDTVLALQREDGGEEPGDALFFQVLPARRDLKKGGAGELVASERVVCAAAFAAPGADAAAVAARIRDAISDVVPFFERHLVRESVPALAAPKDRRAVAPSPHPLYAPWQDAALGVSGIAARALKNVVFAAREVVPGLGVEGQFHAGVQAAAAAQALLGRRDLLR
jgi:phytoene dehydrogenase-like protein